MHVIDVNSGSRKGGERGQEQNALETNLECAEEIARVFAYAIWAVLLLSTL